jgi:hypothetical protein
VQQPPERLGSRYRVVRPTIPGGLGFVVDAEANEGLVVRDDRAGQLAVLPAGTVSGLPVTLRWRYRLQLVLPAEPTSAGSRT